MADRVGQQPCCGARTQSSAKALAANGAFTEAKYHANSTLILSECLPIKGIQPELE